MSDQSTPLIGGDMYAECVETPDPEAATEQINERLKEAVVDGNLELLPQLYTQRAVWRMHGNHACEAKNDLQAALRGNLTADARLEAYLLLNTCYRMLKDSDGVTQTVDILRQCVREGSVSSALALREVLVCIHGSAVNASVAENERLSVSSSEDSPAQPMRKDPPAKVSPALQTPEKEAAAKDVPVKDIPRDTRIKSPRQDRKKGIASGFFSAPGKGKTKTAASAPLGKVKDPKPISAPQEPSSPVPHKENAKPLLSPGSTGTPRSHASKTKKVSKYGSTTVEEVVDMVEDTMDAQSASTPSAVDPSELDRILAAKPRFLQDVPVHEQQQLAQVMGASSQYASGHQHLDMIERNETIGRCIMQINAGQFTQACTDLTAILEKEPQCYQALVARGTCRALAGSTVPAELKKADADFSKAISIMPLLSDVYKRRSQARAALGNLDGAITDLEECLSQCVFENQEGWVEVVRDLATMYHKLRNFAKSRKAFSRYLASVDNSIVGKDTLSMVGLAATAMGDIDEGLRHYNAAIRKDPEFKEAWLNLFQGLKECGRVEEAEKAFSVIERMDNNTKTRSMLAFRFRAHMMQCMGKHAEAIDTLTRALSPLNGRSVSEQRIECLYLRGACNHALGRLALAYSDYDTAFGERVSQSVAQETLNFRAVAYYQGEICVYLHRKLDADVLHFSIDRDLDPEFKECWAKQTLPTPKLLQRCPRQLKRGQKFPPDRKDSPVPSDSALKALIPVADHVGHLLQYTHQGFMNNTRQQRAAGLAAIELAQRFLTEISARQNGSHTWVSSEGASAQDDPSGRHAFAWRDAMDTVVRWRQIGEPNDQVLWVDRLTPEEFNNGFGSHTPMFSGQTKCVRYYMNCDRALKLFASIVLEKGYVVNADNHQIHLSDQQLAAVKKAKTPASMFAAVGVDSFVVVPIHSLSRNGHSLEGTRLTITKQRDQQDAHEFSIRTPVTPARWEDFDKELCAGFEAICNAALTGDKPKAAEAILHYAYYWYNFMPLARGSAAVGYTTILSLFWALDMPISESIPKDYQVDWEAILCQDPEDFVRELQTWMVPPEALEEQSKGHKVDNVVAKYIDPQASDNCPDALSTLGTIRKRFYALNWGTPAEKHTFGRPSFNGSSKRK